MKVTPTTLAMLNNMPRMGEYIFNTRADTIRTGFTKQRTRLARILQKPKLKQIHLRALATIDAHVVFTSLLDDFWIKAWEESARVRTDFDGDASRNSIIFLLIEILT